MRGGDLLIVKILKEPAIAVCFDVLMVTKQKRSQNYVKILLVLVLYRRLNGDDNRCVIICRYCFLLYSFL